LPLEDELGVGGAGVGTVGHPLSGDGFPIKSSVPELGELVEKGLEDALVVEISAD